MDMPVDYCMECNAGMPSEYTPKLTNYIQLKDCFVDEMTRKDLPQEFIDKSIVSFHSRLQPCVAAAGGHSEHCLNTEWAIDN